MRTTSTESTSPTQSLTLPTEVITAEHAMKAAGYESLNHMRWFWTKNPANAERVTQTVYANLCHVTRQAVSQSIGRYEAANPTVESAPNVSPLGGSTKGVRKGGGLGTKKAKVEVVGTSTEPVALGTPTKATLKRHLRELLALGTSVAVEFQAVAPTMTPDQLGTALAQFSAVADTLREAITPPKFTAVEGLSEVEVTEVPVAA